MNSMNIKIKYFTDAIDRLAYIDGKSDWIDLRAAREVVLKKGDFALIPLGVAMELPKGYEAHVVLYERLLSVSRARCEAQQKERLERPNAGVGSP